MARNVRFASNRMIVPCPKCGNNEEFTAYSRPIAEDCCEVWVECKCGYDPTEGDSGARFEDVWGGTTDENVAVAIDCWNSELEAPQ